ncbi:MAG: acyl-CoA dehydrogenase family protein [Ferruginibacter sp.]|nr:acyl-CoA dehydrogenase family protein [Cytophagales bacterium]
MQTPLAQYASAERLEAYLGSPYVPDNVISFKRCMHLDEEELFPASLLEHLHEWDFQCYYIPREYGGKLTTYEELLALGRVLSRRDLTLSITDAHTFLGSLPVWIAGSEGQKQNLARRIKARKAGCLAVTEKDHGSDLVANEVRAEKGANGYVLTGEKWPINKATFTDMLCVLARTDDHHPSRGLSVFLVEKDQLKPGSYRHLPKIKTLGIRGCDISGIRFQDCPLAEEALVGEPGRGLEIVLKGFHVTRTLCAGLSLGAGDTALRTTLRFARSRTLYGDKVLAIPHARNILAQSFLDLLIGDCLAISAVRSLHTVPGQSSLWSAIVKYFVPTHTEKMVQDLSVVLGSRFYLRESHDHGIFQKIVRDHSIVSLFDGSTVVNLHAIALQLPHLAKKRVAREENRATIASDLQRTFSLHQDVPPFDYRKLDLFSRGNNTALQGLEVAYEKLAALRRAGEAEPGVVDALTSLVAEMLTRLAEQEATIRQLPSPAGHNLPLEYFEAAEAYSVIHAAAACVHTWLYNRDHLGEFFGKGEWLVLCLNRLLPTASHPSSLPKTYLENAAQELIRLYEADQLFSIVPLQLVNQASQEIIHSPLTTVPS